MKTVVSWGLATHALVALAWMHGLFYPTPPPEIPGPGGPTTPGPSTPAPAPTPPATPSPTPPTSAPTGGGNPTPPTTGHPKRGGVPPTPASTGGPKTPSGPATGGPKPSGPNTGTPATVPVAALTAALAAGPELGSWETWWFFNRDRFLHLKAHVSALEVATGSDEALLGHGTTAPSNTGIGLVSERVVPALLALLEKERQQDVVTSATIALARIADGPLAARAGEFSHAFAPFATDPNQEIAETSVLARGLVGDDASALELAALLTDAESARAKEPGKAISMRTRAFAGYALGLLGSRTQNEDLRRFVVHHLVRTLREDRGATPDVHVACVLALGLTPLAWSESEHEDVRTPKAAATRGPASVATASRETELECLLAILADSKGDRWVRAHVPAALSHLLDGASEAVRTEVARVHLEIISATANEPDEVVQGCVLAIGRIAGADRTETDVRVRAALQRVGSGSDQTTRNFAFIALAQSAARAETQNSDFGPAEARAFLGRRMAEGRSQERTWAALALGILERGRIQAGESGSIGVRTNLLLALKESGTPEEVGALSIACGLAGDADAVTVLLSKLEHTSDPRTLGHIAIGLGLIGDTRAAKALRTQLADSRFKPGLLRDTAIALALLEDRELVPTLLDTLQKATSLASQSAAAEVIGWIGDRRTIDPLLVLLANRDASASARGFATVALGRVCDLDRLPWNALVSEDVHYRAATATLMAGDGTGLLEIL